MLIINFVFGNQKCVCKNLNLFVQVKTTNPKKYCVRPNTGVVLPGSTCDIIGKKKKLISIFCFSIFLFHNFFAKNSDNKEN